MRTIECSGAPRDIGIEQGSAFEREIVAYCEGQGLRPRRFRLPLPRRLAGGPVRGAGVGRETVRHFPHAVECTTGIARAARVDLDALMEDVVASTYAAPGHPLTRPALGFARANPPHGATVGRALADGAPWILRRSRPEVGFASVEAALPWLPGGVVGVNEAGLAAAVVATDAPPRTSGLRAPPAWLLVQECLQRFADLDGAIGWCCERPAAGDFEIVLADGAGELGRISFAGAERSLAYRGQAEVAIGRSDGEPLATASCADATLRVALHGEALSLSAR